MFPPEENILIYCVYGSRGTGFEFEGTQFGLRQLNLSLNLSRIGVEFELGFEFDWSLM